MLKRKGSYLAVVVVGLAIALVVTLFSPLASSSPDGLEKVAEDKGFIETAKDAPYQVIADYVFPWVGNDKLATVLAGIVGVVIVATVAFGAAYGIRALGRKTESSGKAT